MYLETHAKVLALSEKRSQGWYAMLENFAAGGIAAGVSKTVSAAWVVEFPRRGRCQRVFRIYYVISESVRGAVHPQTANSYGPRSTNHPQGTCRHAMLMSD
jgi:hypothetical protein